MITGDISSKDWVIHPLDITIKQLTHQQATLIHPLPIIVNMMGHLPHLCYPSSDRLFPMSDHSPSTLGEFVLSVEENPTVAAELTSAIFLALAPSVSTLGVTHLSINGSRVYYLIGFYPLRRLHSNFCA